MSWGSEICCVRGQEVEENGTLAEIEVMETL
jgi:hypothetical protein